MNEQKRFQNMRILLGITTTDNSNWEEKIAEINDFGINEIAVFPTCLYQEDRKKLYNSLEKSIVSRIPFVHLRSDMMPDELDYFVERYNTEAFNIHSQSEYPLQYDYSKYKDKIYVENVYEPLDELEIGNFAGICLDLSHLEGEKINNKEYFEHNIKIIEKNRIGVNHISCVKNIPHIDENRIVRYDSHDFIDFTELDYLMDFPLKYFAPIIAIELTNGIKEQLMVRDYIIKILKDKINGQETNSIIT